MNIKFIILILLIIIIVTIFIIKNQQKDNFTNYENFEYSDKLSIEEIKNLKEGQKKMSKMLKVFDDICQKNNIRYFLIGGSLIGVLAYKGWIPWDGDIDLEVHEDDYEKLKNKLKTNLPKNMWFQNNETDPNYKDRILGKLRDLNSCYIDYPYVGKNSHQGLQMDINIYKEENGKISFPDNKNVNYLTKKDVYPLKRVPFEDFKVNVMNNSEKYLVNNYNKNWYKDLPKDKRFPHEGRIDGFNTCKFHYDKYPELYNKN